MKTSQKTALISTLGATTLAVLFLSLVVIFTSDAFYEGKIPYGVHVGNLNIGGKTTMQANELLDVSEASFLQKDMLFRFGDEFWSLNPEEIDLQFNTMGTLEYAYAMGWPEYSQHSSLSSNSANRSSQTSQWVNNLTGRADRILATLDQPRVPLQFTYDDKKLDRFLESIKMSESEARTIEPYVAIAQMKQRINMLSPEYIEITAMPISAINEKRDLPLARQIADELASSPLKLHFEGKTWEMSPESVRSWIQFSSVRISDIDKQSKELSAVSTASHGSTDIIALPQKNTKLEKSLSMHIEDVLHTSLKSNVRLFALQGLTQSSTNQDAEESILMPVIQKNKIEEVLSGISQEIGKSAVDARFHIKDGDIEVVRKSENGIAINTQHAIKEIARAIKGGSRDISLETAAIPARISEHDSKITSSFVELVGIGQSNMGHSSQSRVHNVRLGSSRFDGIVIPPGEEISAGKTIGEVDRAHGFVPELVILDNKTVPQDGGGLCQVATTLFRSIMDAGLEVTQRRNHSYPVSYYSPQGTDATIYYPATDFKFRNDTANFMFIQTSVQGMNVYFEIYGTKDGRTVEIDKPFTYDRRSNGSMKAKWARRVKKDGQTIHDDVFLSVYRSPAEFPHAAN